MIVGAYAVLKLDAVRHNLAKVRICAPAAKIMAVIKANAYGHGLLRIAKTLTDVDAFAVARVNEGICLREAGCTHPITVLEGFTLPNELDAILHYQLDTVVHCVEQLVVLQNRPEQAQLSVWLKMDTGMNRLGFKASTFPDVYSALQQCALVKQPVGLMTHLANADDTHDDFTARQIGLFNEITRGYAAPRSIANSAGLMAWPEALADWVRPGVMLYGISPFSDRAGQSLGLQPVMSLHSHLIAVKPIEKGETLGYGGSWRCEEDTLVGVVAIGYGDGYPRYAKSGTPVLVNGQRAPLIGRVSMDMITVDLAGQPHAKPGDPVLLWGNELPVEEIADCANTIPYTLVCGITQRVQFIDA
ncbi:alanine racemase [Crenothrix sp.]|uniref:alanine racemase n=1 Tax=Crenothrix sp. TaxID=3100433 RepID=UPI00374DA54D